MQLQMDALREVLERSTRDRSDDRSRAAGREQIKLTRLTETDDVEAYLTTFKRLMAIGGIDEDSWAIRLAPQLTGKAQGKVQQAYAAMSREDADSYRKVKEAVLRRYNICAETYRHRFRTTRKKEGEAFVELATRLQDLARKWLSECESAEEAIERIVVEQLVNTLPSDLRIWLSERKPVTSVEAGKLADDYAQARRQVRWTPSNQKEDGGGGGPDKRKCHKCGGEGHFKRNCPVKDEPGADRAGVSPGRNRTDKGIKCFNCHRYGHMSMNCPDKANFYCGDRLGRSVVRVGKVEGAVVSEVVLDTGCSRTMVRRDRVPEENLLPGEAVTVLCAHGDAMLYPLAYVDMEVEEMQLRTKAAIAKELPVAALLGTDILQLGELLRMNTQTRSTNTMNHAMVATRAQAEREEEAELQLQQTERSGVRPREVEGLDGGDGRAEEMERERVGQRERRGDGGRWYSGGEG